MTLPRIRALLVLNLAIVLWTAPLAAQGRGDGLREGFFESQGSHFRILFEGPQDYQLASRALDVLEDAYFRIGSALYTFPERTITVVLYTQQQFHDITRAPAWAAGAYDGRIRLPIRGALSRPEELTRVLSHELTHAIVQTIAPRHVPAWLHEGLAVAFEPDGIERAQAELARTKDRLPFSRFATSFQGLSSEEARLAYAQSALIAKRLLDEGGAATMATLLQDLASGVSFRRAFEDRFFLRFETFFDGSEPGR